MHPLRFPNNGIRAKVFVRKISFKLHVMRLNRVESFYAFLLCFRIEGSPCKGQPGMATASPLAGVAGHLERGGRLRPSPLQGAATNSGSSPAGTNGCGQAAGGGCLLQGRKGQPRGQGYHLQGRPLVGAAASPRGAA
ncbi:hypothetical protein GW17_00059208 [Ensete ventricosum]|nr:hypothetical protein GW17_00059208 [Ensete ventricosum]